MTRTAVRCRPPLPRADLPRRDEGLVRSCVLQAAALRYLRDRLLSQDPDDSVPDSSHGTSRTETSQTATRRPA
jgi:hypothetical protein